MNNHTITIPNNLYQKTNKLASQEQKSVPEIIHELLELGWQTKASGLSANWITMEKEAEQDIKNGHISEPYTNQESLQKALDDLKK